MVSMHDPIRIQSWFCWKLSWGLLLTNLYCDESKSLSRNLSNTLACLCSLVDKARK